MSKVFVECRWLVMEDWQDTFWEAWRLAKSLQCELWINWSLWIVYEDIYALIPLFISAETQDRIAAFQEASKTLLTCLDLRPFKGNLNHLTSLHEYFSNRPTTTYQFVYDHLNHAQAHNQRVRDGLPLWVQMMWEDQQIDEVRLTSLLQRADSAGLTIHYRKRDFSYGINHRSLRDVQLYFRSLDYTCFDTRMNEIQRAFSFKYWHSVPARHACDEYETFPQLTPETIAVLLADIYPDHK